MGEGAKRVITLSLIFEIRINWCSAPSLALPRITGGGDKRGYRYCGNFGGRIQRRVRAAIHAPGPEAA